MLQKYSEMLPEVVKIEQCIGARPMVSFKKNKINMIQLIASEITKYCIAVGVSMDPARLIIISGDVYEVWKHESILDIKRAIDNGRRGLYGTTYKNITTENINKFMAAHLEEKYAAKESELEKQNVESKEPLDFVDYDAYKKRHEKEKRENKPKDDTDFNNFKTKYLKDRAIAEKKKG